MSIYRSHKIFGRTVKGLIAVLLMLLCTYPMIYVLLSSFKSSDDFLHLASYQLPSHLDFVNYWTVFEQGRILTYFKNSIIITLTTVILLLGLASLAGFGLSKINFRGKKTLLFYFNLGLMLPMQVALIPLFYVFSAISLLDTYPAVIIPQVAFSLAFSIQIFYSFYKFLPNDIVEAGIIDGCSPLQIFTKIVVPVSQNAFLTVATMQGVFCWNEFITTYTFTKSISMKTVTLGLNDFVGMYGLTDWGATFAMIILTVLPTLLVYFLANKYMLAGLSAGAVKG